MEIADIKKYVAEFGGTCALTLVGCGTLMLISYKLGTISVLAMLAVALAFGLTLTAMYYATAHISGGHLNPAVSFAMLIEGEISFKDFLFYVLAQLLGAATGAAVLYWMAAWSFGLEAFAVVGMGQNGYGIASGIGLSVYGALVIEVVLTCIFVYVVLNTRKGGRNGKIVGIVEGFTFTALYVFGIPMTNGGLNPARSFGPAVFYGGLALKQLWVFLLAPIIGATIATFIFKFINHQSGPVQESDDDDDDE